ncbi:YwmB family TATA-box binding protein [Tepidibacillus fermentans]|uniref:TATA-box binding protein n=1 Tax=Tepidibacillus fermentans TaxID=1281767 RepID=A0A4R3KIM4_9BACI|nr:YwmB family TATA-box binding protein [Tepidibacillus fermentans]TCS83388.1 TATA-box binding protein [Tepidibacillus fermentans]
MIKKKHLGYMILISILFLLGMTVPNNNKNDLQLLLNGFQQTKAELKQYSFHVGIPYQPLKEEQLFTKGKELSQIFHLPVGKVESFDQQPFYASKGTWENGTEIELQLKNINQNTNTYLVIKVTGNRSFQELEQDYQTFNKLLQMAHINPKINTCVQGEISDKLNNAEQYQLIQKVLKKIDASIVEELKTDLVTSVSAYSPEVGQAIQTKGGEMNLQMATHYDSLHNKTILTMGTPIITIEY